MSSKGKIRRTAFFSSIRPELFIMAFIIAAVFYQLTLHERLTNDGALTIDAHGNFTVVHDHEFAKKLVEDGRALANFNPNTCRIIAVYDVDMNSIWRISFVDHPDIFYDDSIYPDEVKKGENRDGNFFFTTQDGKHVRVTYKWNTSPNGHDYLMVYSTDVDEEKAVTRHLVTSYVIITLCFIMIVNITYWQIHGITNRYRNLMLQDRNNTTF